MHAEYKKLKCACPKQGNNSKNEKFWMLCFNGFCMMYIVCKINLFGLCMHNLNESERDEEYISYKCKHICKKKVCIILISLVSCM